MNPELRKLRFNNVECQNTWQQRNIILTPRRHNSLSPTPPLPHSPSLSLCEHIICDMCVSGCTHTHTHAAAQISCSGLNCNFQSSRWERVLEELSRRTTLSWFCRFKAHFHPGIYDMSSGFGAAAEHWLVRHVHLVENVMFNNWVVLIPEWVFIFMCVLTDTMYRSWYLSLWRTTSMVQQTNQQTPQYQCITS